MSEPIAPISPDIDNEGEQTEEKAVGLRLAEHMGIISEHAERAHADLFRKIFLGPNIRRKIEQEALSIESGLDELDSELATNGFNESSLIGLNRMLMDIYNLAVHENSAVSRTAKISEIYLKLSEIIIKHINALEPAVVVFDRGITRRTCRLLEQLLAVEELQITNRQHGAVINGWVLERLPKCLASIDKALSGAEESDDIKEYSGLFRLTIANFSPVERKDLMPRIADAFIKDYDRDFTGSITEHILRNRNLYRQNTLADIAPDEQKELDIIEKILIKVGFDEKDAFHLVQS